MIAETNQKYAVFRSQDVVQKDLYIMLMLLGKLVLTAAEVHDQPERQRNIHTPGKEGNLLRYGVLEDLDIVFGEVLNQGAARISRAKSDVDQLNLDPDRLLAQTDARRDEQAENQMAHESTPLELWLTLANEGQGTAMSWSYDPFDGIVPSRMPHEPGRTRVALKREQRTAGFRMHVPLGHELLCSRKLSTNARVCRKPLAGAVDAGCYGN